MEVVAGKAVIRKREMDKTIRNAYAVAIVCLLFSMVFALLVLRSNGNQSTIAILDNAGSVHRAEVIPFPEAKDYHRHLKDMGIAGIYTRDQEGAMNNFLEAIATPETVRKADLLWRDLLPVWRQKKVIQYPRVKGYIVDVISDNEMHLKVSLQLVRQAFALDGSEFPGVEDRNVVLYFKRNEDLTDNFYKPWELVDFLEVAANKES